MYAYQTSLKLRIKILDNFTLISLIILNFSDFQFCDNVILLFLLLVLSNCVSDFKFAANRFDANHLL